jgi:hypothetical protein
VLCCVRKPKRQLVRLARLNGQLSVTQAEGAEYVGKYSAAKSEVAGLSRQLEEVRWGAHLDWLMLCTRCTCMSGFHAIFCCVVLCTKAKALVGAAG